MVSDPPVHVAGGANVAMAPSHPTVAETVDVSVSDGDAPLASPVSYSAVYRVVPDVAPVLPKLV